MVILGFVAMLNEIRFGQISHETVERFMSLSRPLQTVNGVEPTELCVISSRG